MKPKHFRDLIAVCVLLLFSVGVRAADGLFSVYWENDSRYIKPNHSADRHYTQGLKLVYSFQPDWQWLEDFGDWGGAARDEESVQAVGFFFGQNIYTPNHVDDPAKRKDKERVFAGWLYGGMFIEQRRTDILDHLELNVGIVGPSSRAYRAQRCIHHVLGSSQPVGWEDQIGDEPAADFTWVRKQRHDKGLFEEHDNLDMITDIGFTAGSLHRHVEAGLMLRYGRTLPDDFGPGRLSLPTSPASRDPQNKRSVYLFGRLAGRAVQYDRFLSGLTHRPLVGRAEVGVVCRLNDLEIAYAQTFLTEEYKEQGFTDSYGALTVTWLF